MSPSPCVPFCKWCVPPVLPSGSCRGPGHTEQSTPPPPARHHYLVSRTVRHPYPPVLVRNGAALGEETHTPKPAASQSTKLTCLTLPCCRRHSQGPFFSYHRDVAMTSPGRSIALEKPPGRMREVITPLPPLPGQALPNQDVHSGMCWHSQGPRSETKVTLGTAPWQVSRGGEPGGPSD